MRVEVAALLAADNKYQDYRSLHWTLFVFDAGNMPIRKLQTDRRATGSVNVPGSVLAVVRRWAVVGV